MLKQKLEAVVYVLIGVVVTLCALSWGLYLIDFGPRLRWEIVCLSGWRGWLDFGTGALALLSILLVTASGFVKERATVTVEGVHDGP